MKKESNYKLYLSVLFIFALAFNSCEKEVPERPQVFNVRLTNSYYSAYTITRIEIRQRGPIGGDLVPTDVWSTNLLKDGATLEPAGQIDFTLPLLEGNWVEYRLGINNNGTELMLYDQPNYAGIKDLSISHKDTHWRSVSVTIVYDQSYSQIVVSACTDIAWNPQ
jgi:hypothetical protein